MDHLSSAGRARNTPGPPAQRREVLEHHQKFRYYSPLLFSGSASLPLMVSLCQTHGAHIFLDLPSQKKPF